jgi:hypothetical protein
VEQRPHYNEFRTRIFNGVSVRQIFHTKPIRMNNGRRERKERSIGRKHPPASRGRLGWFAKGFLGNRRSPRTQTNIPYYVQRTSTLIALRSRPLTCHSCYFNRPPVLVVWLTLLLTAPRRDVSISAARQGARTQHATQQLGIFLVEGKALYIK